MLFLRKKFIVHARFFCSMLDFLKDKSLDKHETLAIKVAYIGTKCKFK